LSKFAFAGCFLKVFWAQGFFSLEVIMLKRVVLRLLQRVNERNFQLDRNLIEVIFSNKAAKHSETIRIFSFRDLKKISTLQMKGW